MRGSPRQGSLSRSWSHHSLQDESRIFFYFPPSPPFCLFCEASKIFGPNRKEIIRKFPSKSSVADNKRQGSGGKGQKKKQIRQRRQRPIRQSKHRGWWTGNYRPALVESELMQLNFGLRVPLIAAAKCWIGRGGVSSAICWDVPTLIEIYAATAPFDWIEGVRGVGVGFPSCGENI